MNQLTLAAAATCLAWLTACTAAPLRQPLDEPLGADGGSGGASVGTATDSVTGDAGGTDAPTTTDTTTDTSSNSGTATEEAPNCLDNGDEPNDTQATATDLGAIDDCDDGGGYLSGVLGGDDVDWYAYSGADTFGCIVNPGRDFDATGPVRVCAYLAWPGLDLDCPEGATLDISPFGFPGCCSATSFELWPSCDTWDDEAKVYIRIDQPDPKARVDYDLAYHF